MLRLSNRFHLHVPAQVGGSTVAAAVGEATSVSRARLREMYNTMGDLGDVAQACKRTQVRLCSLASWRGLV